MRPAGEMGQPCFTGSVFSIDYLAHNDSGNNPQEISTEETHKRTKDPICFFSPLLIDPPRPDNGKPLLLNLFLVVTSQRSKQCSKRVVGKVAVFEPKLLSLWGIPRKGKIP